MTAFPASPRRVQVLRLLQLAGVAVTSTLAGCPPSSDGNTLPTGFTIALTTPIADIIRGNQGSVTVTIIRSPGFTGAVALTEESASTGVSIAAATIPSSATSATMTISVDQTALAGDANFFRIVGAAEGYVSAAVVGAFRVTVPGTFYLTKPAPDGSAFPGQIYHASITVNRASYTQPVTLTAGNAVNNSAAQVAGFTTTFSPAITIDNSVDNIISVSVAVPANAGIEDYQIPITATGPGAPAAYFNLLIQVHNPSFTISATAPASPITIGSSGTATVTATRDPGFTGVISLTGAVFVAHQLVPGITITPVSIPASGTTATLQINVGSNVAPGSYTVDVNGTTPGQTGSQYVGIPIMVPGYSLNVVTAPLLVITPSSTQDIVNFDRVNFTGAIAVTGSSDLGITVTANPASTTADQTTLTVAVGPGVSLGTHSVALHGVAAGFADVNITFAVVVSAAPNPVASVTLAPAAISMNMGDAPVTLTATLKDAGGLPTTGTLGWSSDVPAIATVTPGTTTAQVSAVAPGVTAVTANNAAANVFGRTLVRVAGTSGVARIVVSPFHLVFSLGGTHTYTAQSYNKLDVEILGSTVTWESSNPAVASVDPVTGLVTANTTGGAIITARRDGQYSTGAVTVGNLGAIKGTLSSTTGQYLLGAKATARQGGVVMAVVTVDPGTNQFYIPGLPAGSTQVTIEVTGYSSQTQSATVTANQFVLLSVFTFP